MRPKIESRNSGDHELWNHEIRGFPVLQTVRRIINGKMDTRTLEENLCDIHRRM